MNNTPRPGASPPVDAGGLSGRIEARVAAKVLGRTVPALLVSMELGSAAIWLGDPAHNWAFCCILSAIAPALLLLVAWWLARTGHALRQALAEDQSRRRQLEKTSRELAEREAALEESEIRRKILFESSPVPIILLDAATLRFIDCNPAAVQIYGFASREESLSKSPLDVSAPLQGDGTPSPEKARFYIEQALAGGAVAFEWRHRQPSGRIWDAEVHLTGSRSGARPLLQGTLREITERKRMENLLVESERLRTVAGLAAGVAHEINNPLAGMVQNAQVILARLTQETPANQQAAQRQGTTFAAICGFVADRQIADMLASVRTAGEQAAQIVQGLLAYSRRDQRRASVHLAELVERTLELAASDYELRKQDGLAGVEIVREFATEAPAVVCRPDQMQQVLLNLIRNAVQAMRANPPGRPRRLCLRLRYDGGSASIEVADTGPGIAPEHRARLFEPFFSTKPVGEGTGLGLFVSRHLVMENHGGRLTVDSPPGQGACFRIDLPLGEVKGELR